MAEVAFLDKLVNDFVAWAQQIDECRAVLLFGSTSRGGGDRYSDRDIQVIVTDQQSQQYINWMRDYASLWTAINESDAAKPFWAIMFRGGHKVHLSIVSVEDMEDTIASEESKLQYQRGFKMLIDKDNIEPRMQSPQPLTHPPPTEFDFSDTVQNFFFGTCLIAKYIKRGDLWTLQGAHCIERGFVLRMLEWHTHIHQPNIDTHYRGKQMHDWLDAELWNRLENIVGHFNIEDSWRALFALIDVFSTAARAVATHYDHSYPESMTQEVIAYLKDLHQTR